MLYCAKDATIPERMPPIDNVLNLKFLKFSLKTILFDLQEMMNSHEQITVSVIQEILKGEQQMDHFR